MLSNKDSNEPGLLRAIYHKPERGLPLLRDRMGYTQILAQPPLLTFFVLLRLSFRSRPKASINQPSGQHMPSRCIDKFRCGFPQTIVCLHNILSMCRISKLAFIVKGLNILTTLLKNHLSNKYHKSSRLKR